MAALFWQLQRQPRNVSDGMANAITFSVAIDQQSLYALRTNPEANL
jgi:hypothetical protein